MHILAVDTETCALGPGRDRIVQFCVREMDSELRTKSQWTQLVHPGRPIPAAATAIHGITDAMVADQPRFSDVAPLLRSLFLPDSIFMAYNAGFDLGVLDLEFSRAGQPPLGGLRVLDPLAVERHVTSRSLGPTYRRYTGMDLKNAHTADADVDAMVEVLRAQRRVHAHLLPPRIGDLVALPRARRRNHLVRDESGIVRLGFGKHAGRPASEVPSYLAWMLDEDFPEPVKEEVRTILGARPP